MLKVAQLANSGFFLFYHYKKIIIKFSQLVWVNAKIAYPIVRYAQMDRNARNVCQDIKCS